MASSLAAPAQAQPAAHKSAADALFTEARELLGAGRPAEACPKLAESLRLDPAAGTALNLADCYERINRTASAYITFGDAATLARRDGDTSRAEEATRRADALQPKLMRLAVNVPDQSRLKEIVILRDGQPLPPSLWGTAVPLDPGEHVVEAKAPNHIPWKTTAQLTAPGTTQQVTIPLLAEAAPPPPPGSGTQRIAGIVIGSVGLAALATAGGLSIAAIRTDAASKQHCLSEDPNKCYAEGVALRNESISYANVATGFAIAGGVAVATGVTLFLLGRPSRPSDKAARTWILAPHLTSREAGLTFGATF